MVLQKNHSYIDLVMSLTPGGMKSGRDEVIKLLSFLGSPQNTFKIFHVTGSNGKGSVCQMISQVLHKQFGKKVGLFTSPHLIDITERFQINGKPISHSKLNTYYKKVLNLTKKYSTELSFFEIQVVAMVLYFADERVDYVVIEVGLGGIYDGTNIFEHPLACFITSVTLEHTHLLGKTRMSVLKNKLGIVKTGTTLYTHLKNQQVIEYCGKHNVRLLQPAHSPTCPLTNLPGNHQQKNALLVLQSLTDLGYDEGRVLDGLKKIYNPGRFEWISPAVLVDSANNQQNIQLLKKMLRNDSYDNAVIIFGTTQTDPIYAAQLANTFHYNKKILVDGFCERALPCSEYSENVSFDKIWHLNTREGQECIKGVLKEKKSKKYILYGSIYLVGYVMGLSRYDIFAKH